MTSAGGGPLLYTLGRTRAFSWLLDKLAFGSIRSWMHQSSTAASEKSRQSRALISMDVLSRQVTVTLGTLLANFMSFGRASIFVRTPTKDIKFASSVPKVTV